MLTEKRKMHILSALHLESMDAEYQKNMARSYYALARVILILPIVGISCAFFGKWLDVRMETGDARMMLLSMAASTAAFVLYITYEYKRMQKYWRASKNEREEKIPNGEV